MNSLWTAILYGTVGGAGGGVVGFLVVLFRLHARKIAGLEKRLQELAETIDAHDRSLRRDDETIKILLENMILLLKKLPDDATAEFAPLE